MALRGWKAHQDLHGDAPAGQPALIRAALTVATILNDIERPHDAQDYVKISAQILARMPKDFADPVQNPLLPSSLLVEAEIAERTGNHHAARTAAEKAQKALDVLVKSRPKVHPDRAAALHVLARSLIEQDEGPNAAEPLQEALQILEQCYPNGHPSRAAVHGSLAKVHYLRGKKSDALASVAKAFDEYKRLFPKTEEKYPRGHPGLIRAKTEYGDWLRQIGQKEEALVLLREAKEESRSFFAGPHEIQLAALLSYGRSLRECGKLAEAASLIEEAEQSARALDARNPRGALAVCLLERGGIEAEREQYPQAQATLEQALAICRASAPKGHPQLSAISQALGAIYLLRGDSVKSRSAFIDALAVDQQELARFASKAAEAEALAYARPRQLSYHGYLAASRAQRGAEDQGYGLIWQAKAAVTRLLQERRAATRLALDRFDAPAHQLWTRLVDTRTQLSWLVTNRQEDPVSRDQRLATLTEMKEKLERELQARVAGFHAARENDAPAHQLWTRLVDTRTQLSWLVTSRQEDPVSRDQRLATLTETKEKLERELEASVAGFRAAREDSAQGPARLADKLPRGAAFVDFVRYVDALNHVPPQSFYAAFVVSAGGKPTRVDLGPALPIDEAVNGWRKSLAGWKTARALGPDVQRSWIAEGDQHSAALRRLVWEPVAAQLAVGTRLIYLALDGDLARFPFAVLPGDKTDSILLEDYLIAQVPHGPFLLEQLLQAGEAESGGGVLAVGAVAYGEPEPQLARRFTYLPGTAAEIAAAAKDADPGRLIVLSQNQATRKAVCDALPAASEALFATHGFFRDEELKSEHERILEHLRSWSSMTAHVAPPISSAGRHPLGYVGLALAGANQPGKSGADGFLTGETIAELRVDRLRLVVLSACETGLGEHTAGEGVQGLVRAFHLAGCPNVVASLWRVDDDATRILMTEFYRQMREEKKSPLEALRLAQLSMYRSAPGAQPAHPYLWAAFVCSGAGLPLSVDCADADSWVRYAYRPSAEAVENGKSAWTSHVAWLAPLLAACAVVILAFQRRRTAPSAEVGKT
jgi:CHAT domain-containing protein